MSTTTLWRRLRCAVGRHRWRPDRYVSLGGHLVEVKVCRDCKLTVRERRIIERGPLKGGLT
jgi:hypothetical protein